MNKEMKKEKYRIEPVANWINPSDYQTQHQPEPTPPFSFILVDYQDLIKENEIHHYKRTIEQINDVSRIEDASLYITELEENETIVFHSIEIIRGEKRINVLHEDAILVTQRETSLERHITDKRLTVSFSIDDLRVGDMVDYQATLLNIASDHPINGRYYRTVFRLNWECPVYKQNIAIVNQSKQSILAQYCTLESGEYCTKTESIKPGHTFQETIDNLEQRHIEDISPYWLWPDTLIATTETTWSEVSSYLFKYYESQEDVFSKTDLAELDEITLSGKTSENIITLVRFVQNEIRYKGENHGIFTHTPKSPNLTLKRRYGDCKDKSNLLVALLRNINVDAYLTLVNTNFGLKIGSLNPSPTHFNHMIVCVHYDGETYYFDPTIKKQAGDLSNSVHLDYGYGLLLTNEGAELKKLPYTIDKDVYHLKHILDFTETTEGLGTIAIERTYFANRANNMRYYLNSNDIRTLGKEYLDSAAEDSDFELSALKPLEIVQDDLVNNILITEEKYTISQLPKSDGEKRIHIPTKFYQDFPTSKNRDLPFRVDLEGRVAHRIEAKYKGEAINSSDEKTIKNPWISYQDKVSTSGDTIYFDAAITPLKEYVKSQDLEQYIEGLDQLYARHMNNIPTTCLNATSYSKIGNIMLVTAVLIAVIVAFFQ